MLKAVFFDLDHTLYDRYATMERTLPECWERLREYISDDVTYEQFRDMMIDADKKYNYDGWDVRAEHLRSLGLLKKPIAAWDLRIITYETLMSTAVHFDYTLPLLTRLRERGYKLGIITNGEVYIQRAKLERLDFYGYFDIVYLCEEHDVRKPMPEPFLDAARLAGVEPDECLYVGDHPRNDISGAKGAGFETVWVATCGPWRYDLYERADFEVADISHLEEILPEIEADMKKKAENRENFH